MEKMKLGNLDIPLPHIARDLCIEAVTLADQLRGDVSDKKLKKYFKKFFAEYMKFLTDILAHGIPDLGFDPFDLSTIPESMLDDDQALSKIFARYNNSQEFVQSTGADLDDGHDLQSASILLLYVELLRELEELALKGGNLDYKQIMATTSQQILSLHRLILVLKSQPSQAKLYANNLQRVRGARKGGAAKANRLKELRELVLQEARQNFGTSPATKAAAAIFQKLSGQGTWLQDEKGKMLLSDPETRFTAWIRSERKQKPA